MNQKTQTQTYDDVIPSIGVILFLKSCGGNIIKTTLGCLLAGGVYYFYIPSLYIASATIEMATVAGQQVESTALLSEKLKLPFYFSPSTLQICGLDGELDLPDKFVDKIKPIINRSSPQFLSIVTKAQSTREAKACLNAVIADVSSNQDAIAKTVLQLRKQDLQFLTERLNIADEAVNLLFALKDNNKSNDVQNSIHRLKIIFEKLKINSLRKQIIDTERSLVASKNRPTYLVSSVYAAEVPANKRPLFTLGLCLALGLILGLLVTGVLRLMPDIWRQLREGESRAE